MARQRIAISRQVLLTRLVMKELADNGLDAGAEVEVGKLPTKRGYYVDDSGPSIDGTPEYIAYLFSIRRHMVSTKLLRLPTRGAVGNGLRVVAGAVLASGGSLTVVTRNKRIELRPEREGHTTVVSVKSVKRPVGTRIEITFGPDLPCDKDTLDWAHKACRLAQYGSTYAGKSSPHWYDETQFHDLLDALLATARCVIWSLSSTAAPAARLVRSLTLLASTAPSARTSPVSKPRSCLR
jgi:hypothetical protein